MVNECRHRSIGCENAGNVFVETGNALSLFIFKNNLKYIYHGNKIYTPINKP